MASPLNRPGVQNRGRVAAFPTSKVGEPPVGGGPWGPYPGAHSLFASKSGSLASKPGGPLSICIMQMNYPKTSRRQSNPIFSVLPALPPRIQAGRFTSD